MTLTLQFPPDIEAGLLSQAKAEGMDVSEYIQHLVREQIVAKTSAIEAFRPAVELSSQERLNHLQKFLESHAGNTVVLTNEAMDRESIYGDRGL